MSSKHSEADNGAPEQFKFVINLLGGEPEEEDSLDGSSFLEEEGEQEQSEGQASGQEERVHGQMDIAEGEEQQYVAFATNQQNIRNEGEQQQEVGEGMEHKTLLQEEETRMANIQQEAGEFPHLVGQTVDECQDDEEMNPATQRYPTLVVEASHDDQAVEEEKSNVPDAIGGASSQGAPESFSGDVPPREEGSVVFSEDQEDGGLPMMADDRKISIQLFPAPITKKDDGRKISIQLDFSQAQKQSSESEDINQIQINQEQIIENNQNLQYKIKFDMDNFQLPIQDPVENQGQKEEEAMAAVEQAPQQAPGENGAIQLDFGISFNFDGAQDDCQMKQSDDEINESIEGEQDDMEVEDLEQAPAEEPGQIEEVEDQHAPDDSGFLDLNELIDQHSSPGAGTNPRRLEGLSESLKIDLAQTQQNEILVEAPSQDLNFLQEQKEMMNDEQLLHMQSNTDFNMNLADLNLGASFMDPELQEPPKPKPNKNRAHFNISDFYKLRKIKYTIEFDGPLKNKLLKRTQFIYTLDLKEDEIVEKLIKERQEVGHKRIYIDLGIHLKQHRITNICLLDKVGEMGGYARGEQIPIPFESDTYGMMPSLGNLKPAYKNQKFNEDIDELLNQSQKRSWYLNPAAQAALFKTSLGSKNLSRDLNTLDYLQKDICYYKEAETQESEENPFEQPGYTPLLRDPSVYLLHKKPEFHRQKFITLKELRKSDAKSIIANQLKKEIKMLITIGEPTALSNFGIRAIDYKPEDSMTVQLNSQLNTYFVTSDIHEASQLWLPQLFGTTRDPVGWSMNYIVPKGCQVVSSGDFVKQDDLDQGKTLFTFKCKEDKKIADKIGFVIGEFPYVSSFDQGAALFTSNQKLQLFEAKGFYADQVHQIIDYIEKMIKIEHPSKSGHNLDQLKLVFLPNLFLRKQAKQSLDFATCIHIFDQDVLLPRNVIEKRHKIYKVMATSIAYDYFGNQVWEEKESDQWLLTSLRERIGDRYKRLKCGQTFYRYHIAKITKKFYKKVKENADRFSLSSAYVPHFSEIQYGEDLYYWKCQLIMHIVEQQLVDPHFSMVVHDLFRKSKPTMTLLLFKRLLKDKGMTKGQLNDIQRNWIDSTSCPKIECTTTYNKKNNSLDITLEQHSVMKRQFMLEDYLEEQQLRHDEICSNGKTLLKSLEDRCKQEVLDQKKSFKVEPNRDCRRWFVGDIKVVIYQTDGADITAQTQVIKLKYPKTKVQCNIPLKCKVRKAINNKKRDENMLMYDTCFNDQRRDDEKMVSKEGMGQIDSVLGNKKGIISTAEVEKLVQLDNDNNEWRFGMTDYEFEEYPQAERKTKSLFEVKNIECPILWIRVDPEIEYIRKVKIHQAPDNWLFQLLQEKDHMGQIEACKALKNQHDEDVYEILKAVAKNEKFFFKVRKQALRSLEAIQVSAFQEFLSHEKTFLINYYKSRNFNDKIGFYKSNNFENTLEYYVNTYLLRSLSKSKEHKLSITSDISQIKWKAQMDMTMNLVNTDLQPMQNLNFKKVEKKEEEEHEYGKDKKKKGDEEQSLDMREFSITTGLISDLMLKLLRENDNSENAFDDCFLVGKILAGLGNLDNFECMPAIAEDIQRQFNFDHIGKFSTQYAVSKGAITGYYNIRKQIYRYNQFKMPYLDLERGDKAKNQHEKEQDDERILQTERILDEMKEELESILNDQSWPMELRAFIFEKKVKNEFLYTKDVIPNTKIPSQFLNPLFWLLKQIQSSLSGRHYQFAAIQLEALANFLEKHFMKRLNFKECLHQNDEKSKIIAQMLWYIMAEQPVTCIDRQCSHWTKRIYNAVFFGSRLPVPLRRETDELGIQPPYAVDFDEYWQESEERQQMEEDQRDIQNVREKQHAFNLGQKKDEVIQPEEKLGMPNSFMPLTQFDPEALGLQQKLWLANQNQLLPHDYEAYPNNLNIVIPQSQQPIPNPILPGVFDQMGVEQPNNLINVQQMLNNAELKNQLPAATIPSANSNVITLFDMGQDVVQHQIEQTPYLRKDDAYGSEHNYVQEDDPNRIGFNFYEDDVSVKKEKKSKKKKAKRQIAESEDDIEDKNQEDGEYQRITYEDEWEPVDKEVSNSEELIAGEEIDDFPDYEFHEVWQQKCWDILYKLYYDVHSAPFLDAISEEAMGQEFFEDYVTHIQPNIPINFHMIKQKLIKHLYGEHEDCVHYFITDMNMVFDNCIKYNERKSEYYKSAQKLKNKLKRMLRELKLARD